MQMPTHDRYDYSPIVERADYDWPGGKRLAVHIALNIEHFKFGEGLGHTPTALKPPPDQRNYAWRDYGLRVGIWRILDLLDELKLPACHLLNTTVYDYAPQIPARLRARGDEIVGHGRTNSETQAEMAEADESALIREVTDKIKAEEGKPPQGWMSPWIAETAATPDLLKEAGYTYLMNWPCDDQPIWMRTRSGPILSVPYPAEINDSPAHLDRRHTAEDFAQMAIDQFDAMVEESERHPLVMGIALHTFVVGQPFRFVQVRRLLTHMAHHPLAGRVWFTRPGEIAQHIMSLPRGTVPGDAG